MEAQQLFQRYQELQQYVGWTDQDAQRVWSVCELVEPHLPALIADFYEVIQRHPNAAKVITGGAAQVERLKTTLLRWLHELFTGPYDQQYVRRRWQVGRRHVEIGLDQVYTNAALSRLRSGLHRAIRENWRGDTHELNLTAASLDRLIDLDLAMIEDAYQSEHQERRRQAERLATIGQVAGGIAHELRNPLNVVKTSVYYLRHARNPSEEKKSQHLERIERQVEAADRVITALNDFAKLPLPEFQPFALEGCLEEALHGALLPANIEVVWNLPQQPPAVLGDERQLGIVFSNLIRNARDAMPDGGTLTLAAESPDDEHIEVAVIDTGVGIKSEDLQRISEPLFSTKARGIGLGLAMSRAILEKHGSRLKVESEEGRGAKFSTWLPTAVGPVPAGGSPQGV